MESLKQISLYLSIFLILSLFGFGAMQFSFNEKPIEDDGYKIDLSRESKFMKKQFELSNYCEISSDCINIGSYCPLGCEIFVNNSRVKDITNLVSKFQPQCVYDCQYGNSNALCKNNVCVAIRPYQGL